MLGADRDSGQTLIYGITGGTVSGGLSTMAGTYGSLSVNTSTGAYTYTPSAAAINGLTANATDTFAVTVSDGFASTQATYVVNLWDKTSPTVGSVLVTSATGVENNTLNEGDVVSVTVTTSEAVVVTGTPQLELNIGGTAVLANYSSGSNSTGLVFTYTIANGQTDTDGISIEENKLTLNGGTLKDAAGNDLTLSHLSVADNDSFKVDKRPKKV